MAGGESGTSSAHRNCCYRCIKPIQPITSSQRKGLLLLISVEQIHARWRGGALPYLVLLPARSLSSGARTWSHSPSWRPRPRSSPARLQRARDSAASHPRLLLLLLSRAPSSSWTPEPVDDPIKSSSSKDCRAPLALSRPGTGSGCAGSALIPKLLLLLLPGRQLQLLRPRRRPLALE